MPVPPTPAELPVPMRDLFLPGDLPACPPGWHIAPPDFVGVGVQRCGTTRWFDLLLRHPGVVAPIATRKELHFFDRFHRGGFTASDADEYAAYFPRPAGALIGEWTATYATDFWTPPLLARAAPQTRVLVSLRDPVERYLSGLRRHQRFAEELGVGMDRNAPHNEFTRGCYAEQLRRLLRSVPSERVLVLQFERCVAEPHAELVRTFAFLGLQPVDLGAIVHEHHPNRLPVKPALDTATRAALIAAYEPDVLRLGTIMPDLDLSLWPNFAHLSARS